ncbi:hypothetical protein EXT42_04105 [Pseudoalteromonas sp. CO302Y]|uniref:hypothetical protein n=1 Tax=unclassified Pseudoalteromonas TaxID=194690 RepID=UPI001022D57A|nr:hypothetical protein EXT42_04105 [Pseudoalteromonas sp. CO302Y]RZG10597.1 hypothetical protein EXT40_04105 [Pseudoalteromonas sp. CO133X]
MADNSNNKQAELNAALQHIGRQFGKGAINGGASATHANTGATNSHASATNALSAQQNNKKSNKLNFGWGRFPANSMRVWVSENPRETNKQLVKEAANANIPLKLIDFSKELEQQGSGFLRGEIQQSEQGNNYNSRPSWISGEEFYLFDNVFSAFKNKHLIEEFVRSVYVSRTVLGDQQARSKAHFVDCYSYYEEKIRLALTCTYVEYKVLNSLQRQFPQLDFNLFEFHFVGSD